MPNRIIREDFIRSQRIRELDSEVTPESLYVRLIITADDFGRFDAHSANIATNCYPKKVPATSRMASFAEFVGLIEHCLAKLAAVKLVFIYQHDGQKFGVFYKWNQRLRIRKAKFPTPPPEVLCESNLDDDVDENSPVGRAVRQTVSHTDVPKEKLKLNPKMNQKEKSDCVAVLDYLNEKTGKNYRPIESALTLIVHRLREGHQVSDCISVIDDRCKKWLQPEPGGKDMSEYLRPSTLFRSSKFPEYLAEATKRDLFAGQRPPPKPGNNGHRELWQIKNDIRVAEEEMEKILDPLRYGGRGSLERMRGMAETGDTRAADDRKKWEGWFKRKRELEAEMQP